MPAPAHVVSHTPRRVRIRVPSRRHDGEFFELAKVLFASLPGVESVEANPLTGSLLVHHDTDLEAIAAHGLENDLFELAAPALLGRPLPGRVTAAYSRANAGLKRATGGEMDIPSLALMALLGLGAYQIAAGELAAPPAHIALWYALAILWQTRSPQEAPA